MRDDVVEMSLGDMSPELRALLAYEPNGAFDVLAPQPIYDRIRQETPVIRWDMGVAFFTMDDLVVGCRNPAIVSSNPATGTGMGMGSRDPLIPLHIDGVKHRTYRKLLDPLLAPRRVAPMEADVRKLADELIDSFIGAGQVEFHDAFAKPLPCTIFLSIFGMPLEDFDFLVGSKDRILKNEGTTLEEHEAIGNEAGDRLRQHLLMRLEERRRVGFTGDDLIGHFMTFELDGERLSDDEIANIMHLFTIAGLDTVTSSLSCIAGWLARSPEQRRCVVAEPSLLPAAIEELMRFESPVVASGQRWATEDTEINGVHIKKGDMVFFAWATANLDPGTFGHPMSVDFDRPDNRHVSFAAGIHRCLGSHLARLELRAAIDQFHRRIPDYWITPGEEPEYEWAGVRQARRLPLTFTAAR